MPTANNRDGSKRTALRHRGIGALAGALVVTLALVGTLAVLDRGDSDGTPTRRGAVQARTESASSSVFTDAYFQSLAAPASPGEFKDGIGRLLEFHAAAQHAALQRCLERQGNSEVLPPAAAVIGGQVTYFEDPATLRTDAFGVAANAKSGTPFDPQQPSSAEAACSSEPAPKLDELYSLYGQLSGHWMTHVEQIEHSGALDATWAAFTDCMAQRGYDTPNQDDVYKLVNQAAMSSSSQDDIAQVETPVANADADCLDAGIVPRRTELRLSDRAAFLDSERQAFDTMKSRLSPLVGEISDEYSITY